MIIYHVCAADEWQAQQANGKYSHASLETEGFIHCCKTHEQVEGVLARYFKGQNNLILLHIDTQALDVPVKEELAPSVDDYFPHIYGSIPIAAVIQTTAIQ